MIRWFNSRDEFMAELERSQPALDAAEAFVEQYEMLPGFCTHCAKLVEFKSNGGAMLGEHPNLREGLVCACCGLNNRCRLMLQAIEEDFPPGYERECAVLEATTALATHLRSRYPKLHTSEYFGTAQRPGELVKHRGQQVRHESITQLSYRSEGLSFLAHLDVLEHVFDVGAAFSESSRVLEPEGKLYFTMPFFPYRSSTLVRGRLDEDGRLHEILPSEFHGDGVRDGGIYTFYHFGWDLFDRIGPNLGLAVEFGMTSDAFCGFVGNNHRYGREAWMPALVFRATRQTPRTGG